MPLDKSRLSTVSLVLLILALAATQLFFSYLLLTVGLRFPSLETLCCHTFSSWVSFSTQVVLFFGSLIFLLPTMPLFTKVIFKRQKLDPKASIPFWLVWACPTVILFIVGHINAPYTSYDGSAERAGRKASSVQISYYNDHCGGTEGIYADDLAKLLPCDRTLSEDPYVTFSFGSVTTSGYTFTTTHKCSCGKTVILWTD